MKPAVRFYTPEDAKELGSEGAARMREDVLYAIAHGAWNWTKEVDEMGYEELHARGRNDGRCWWVVRTQEPLTNEAKQAIQDLVAMQWSTS
jgi:hypothetical protein